MKPFVKPLIAMGAFLATTFVCMPLANALQTDFGKVEVSMGSFQDSNTEKALTYKL